MMEIMIMKYDDGLLGGEYIIPGRHNIKLNISGIMHISINKRAIAMYWYRNWTPNSHSMTQNIIMISIKVNKLS